MHVKNRRESYKPGYDPPCVTPHVFKQRHLEEVGRRRSPHLGLAQLWGERHSRWRLAVILRLQGGETMLLAEVGSRTMHVKNRRETFKPGYDPPLPCATP